MTPGRAASPQARLDLLEAAIACLSASGYARLSTRAVAERAGTQASQIHYHFGGKNGLLLAVLEHQNRTLLRGQRGLYASGMPLWKRWEQACNYLEEDLASGYVRVLQELIAVGWSDPDVAAKVNEQLQGWVALLTSVAEEAVATLRIDGLSPRQLAILVGAAFVGAEELELLGIGEPHEVVVSLRALGGLIRTAEEDT